MANGALKYDTGKPPISLISREFLEGLANVLAFGAKKYAAHNWREGMEWSRLADASMRHLLAWVDGEDTDPESGLNHLHHAAFGLMCLATYQRKGAGVDDRHAARVTTGAPPVLPPDTSGMRYPPGTKLCSIVSGRQYKVVGVYDGGRKLMASNATTCSFSIEYIDTSMRPLGSPSGAGI